MHAAHLETMMVVSFLVVMLAYEYVLFVAIAVNFTVDATVYFLFLLQNPLESW